MFCPKCGYTPKSGDSFCRRCGVKLEDNAETASKDVPESVDARQTRRHSDGNLSLLKVPKSVDARQTSSTSFSVSNATEKVDHAYERQGETTSQPITAGKQNDSGQTFLSPTSNSTKVKSDRSSPDFFEAVGSCFVKYCDGRGRASRSEYWFWYLFTIVTFQFPAGILIVLAEEMGDEALPFMIPLVVWGLVLLLPSISVLSRRLHDTNRSRAWLLLLLLVFVPIVKFSVGIYTIVMGAVPGTPGDNKYGPNPNEYSK